MVAVLALVQGAPSALAQTNDLSLAGSFPRETLGSILVPTADWRPFPRAADRDGWEVLSLTARQELVRRGEEALATPLPALPASLYLEYVRNGDRGRFEGPYFERRRHLHRLALAECVEGKGRFIEAIANDLWAIAEESTWCVAAHIGSQRAGGGLPDIDEPIVDLFAAQTGASLAWTLYLLEPQLDTVSTRIAQRARQEVDRRILAPYQERDWGWLGFGTRSRDDRPNNWNPWINGNVLTAALLLERDAGRRVALVHRVLRSLDAFLQPYPSDGGCDEGPGYWTRAGGSVLDNLDLLSSATRGRLDMFQHPLIAEIGRFIYRVHIADDWFVDLGDCSPRLGLERDLLFRYGQAIQDPRLLAQATAGATERDVLRSADGTDLGRSLHALQNVAEIVAGNGARPPLVRDAWLGSDDLQMMVAREEEGSTRGFFVAAWGGHNAQSHNHNDVGNFIVFADGHPVFIDLGAPTYTAKTFSRRRYEIPAMQSDWHNLPTINGVQQAAGRQYAAREVSYVADDHAASLHMDLADAWPEEARVRRWKRVVSLERGRGVRIHEAFELTELAPGAALNLITPCEPALDGRGNIVLPLPVGPNGKGRQVVLSIEPEQLEASIRPERLDDARLSRVWSERIHRIAIKSRSPVNDDAWSLHLRLAGP